MSCIVKDYSPRTPDSAENSCNDMKEKANQLITEVLSDSSCRKRRRNEYEHDVPYSPHTPSGSPPPSPTVSPCNVPPRPPAGKPPPERQQYRLNSVKDHYNVQSEKKPGQMDRMRLSTFPLLQFNNWVKRWLIEREVDYIRNVQKLKDGVRVLDLGCGVGGDLWKYNSAGVGHVTFVDESDYSLQNLVKRKNESRTPLKLSTHNICMDMSDIRLSRNLPYRDYDMVVSMFSLHYIFSQKERVLCLFRTISNALPRNGHFIGIVSNGDVIHKFCTESRQKRFSNFEPLKYVHESPYRSWSFVPQRNHGHTRPRLYGDSYFFTLKHAVEKCEEYFTSVSAVEECAHKVGMRLLNWEPILSMYDKYVKENSQRQHQFEHLSEDLLNLEDCYYYFSLQKL